MRDHPSGSPMLVGSKFTVSDIDKPILAFLLLLSPLEADAMVADYLWFMKVIMTTIYFHHWIWAQADGGCVVVCGVS